jgi:hypothetical protein
MHKPLIAILAAVVLLGAFAMPTEAATNKFRSDGWHIFEMNQRSASTTLIDRTPDQAKVVIYLQKKAGPTKCRARVVINRAGHRYYGVFEKYSRTQARAGYYVLKPGRDRTVGVSISTNGRCIVAVAVK